MNLVAPKKLAGRPGYITGREFLKFYRIKPGTLEAYFTSCLDFPKLALKFGKMGGAEYITTIIKSVIAERGRDRVLVMDGGDTTGYDLFVAHWDFTFGKETFLKRIEELEKGGCEFITHNVVDELWGDLVFKPYTIKEVGGVKLGIIGSSFPFTPLANPRQFV